MERGAAGGAEFSLSTFTSSSLLVLVGPSLVLCVTQQAPAGRRSPTRFVYGLARFAAWEPRGFRFFFSVFFFFCSVFRLYLRGKTFSVSFCNLLHCVRLRACVRARRGGVM